MNELAASADGSRVAARKTCSVSPRIATRIIATFAATNLLTPYSATDCRPTFAKRFAQYKKSLSQGLWKTAYAATNENEFFAELTMWYVGSRGDYGGIKPAPQLGRDWLRNYDPEAFSLLDAIYSGKTKVSRATWKTLAPHPATEEAKLRSLSSEQPTILMFDNRTSHDFSLFWLDFDGKRKPYGLLGAGESVEEHTYATHPWLLAEPSGNVVGIYVPGKENGRAVLR